MKNQFFYKKLDNEGKTLDIEASFSIDRVVRTEMYEPNKLVILLDDFHERVMDKPIMDVRTGQPKMKGQSIQTQRARETVNSEIYLSEDDSKRFRKMFEYTGFEPCTFEMSTGISQPNSIKPVETLA